MASRARAESLEQRVSELEEENARLRERGPDHASSRFGWVLLGITALLVAAALYLGFGVSGYVGERAGIVLGVLAALAVGIGFMWYLVTAEVVQPNELLVLSGRPTPDGRGYRVVRGGRVVRVRLLETSERIDLTPFRVELALRGVAGKRERVGDVSGWARVRISPNDPEVHRALERFLGKRRSEIAEVARETLEGVVREVVSTLTAEELREEAKVREPLRADAERELAKLGLELEDIRLASGA